MLFVSLDLSRLPSKYPDLTYVSLGLSRIPSIYPDLTYVSLDLSRIPSIYPDLIPFQAEREKKKRKLTDEAQAARDEVEEVTGHAPAPKKMALTTPIDTYLKKKTAPQPYQKTGPLQRRIDLEVMTFVATANVPFSVIDQKPFRRCDSSAFANLESEI